MLTASFAFSKIAAVKRFNNAVVQRHISHLSSLGLVLVILFPITASWVNPYYAAIQPVHDHVYLGEIEPGHHRRPILSQLAHHPASSNGHPEDQAESANSDIIFLPDTNANQAGLFLIGCLYAALIINRLDTLGTNLVAPGYKIQTLSLPPSLPPPRPAFF